MGKTLCKVWLVTDYLVCTASVFNIVLISYDRFLSVTKAVSRVWTPLGPGMGRQVAFAVKSISPIALPRGVSGVSETQATL